MAARAGECWRFVCCVVVEAETANDALRTFGGEHGLINIAYSPQMQQHLHLHLYLHTQKACPCTVPFLTLEF
jgi:hypothetical protein